MSVKKAKIIKNGNVNIQNIVVKGKNNLETGKDKIGVITPSTAPPIRKELLPIKLKKVEKLKKGDLFLWKSGMHGHFEIHQFHSDAGYGAKTYTQYSEKDGSSLIVNYSGICGVLVCEEIKQIPNNVVMPYKRFELCYDGHDVEKITGCTPMYDYISEGRCKISKFKDAKGLDVTEEEVIARVKLYMVTIGVIDENDKIRHSLIPYHGFDSPDDEGCRKSSYWFSLNFTVR
jgi:hypothetical protein